MNDISTADDCSTPVHAPWLLEEILHHLECVPKKRRKNIWYEKNPQPSKGVHPFHKNPYFLRTVFDSRDALFPQVWLSVIGKFKSSYYLHNQKKKHGLKESEKKPGGWNMMTLTLTVTYPESWFFHFLSIFDWIGEIGCRRGPQDDYSMPLAPRLPALDHPFGKCAISLWPSRWKLKPKKFWKKHPWHPPVPIFFQDFPNKNSAGWGFGICLYAGISMNIYQLWWHIANP